MLHLDTDEELLDQDRNVCLLAEKTSYPVYLIDPNTIAKPQTGSHPAPDRDPRAPMPEASACPAYKHRRPRNDWEHNRVIGECGYPHDQLELPKRPSANDGFRDWQNLHQKTGLEHFISIPLVLFSHEYRDFVLTAGADAPRWNEVLRHIMSSMDNIFAERA